MPRSLKKPSLAVRRPGAFALEQVAEKWERREPPKVVSTRLREHTLPGLTSPRPRPVARFDRVRQGPAGEGKARLCVIRMGPDMASHLERLARETGRDRSELVAEALAAYWGGSEGRRNCPEGDGDAPS